MSELTETPTPFHSLRAPTLPCELISKIAGYCTGISKFKILLSMCLVSRHWYNATRRYLFKSIPICTENRFSELLALLEANPFIGGWVQEIRFQAGSRCGHNKSLDLEFFYTCPGKLIGKLPAVKKLTFLTFGRHLHPVKSAKALKDCAAAFPRLRILEFWEFYFSSMKDLANFVCGFQELSSLTLSHCVVTSGKEGEDTQDGVREDKNQDIEVLEGNLECPPNLRSLRINTGIEEIHTMAPLLWGLCTSSFIKNLQKFAVFFWSIYRPNNSVYMRAVGALLKILGPSLHILDIGTAKLNRGTSSHVLIKLQEH